MYWIPKEYALASPYTRGSRGEISWDELLMLHLLKAFFSAKRVWAIKMWHQTVESMRIFSICASALELSHI